MAVEPTQTEPTTTTTVTEPTPVSLKDDDIVELTVDGQTVRKPWKEARSGFMMHEDYTRKTQGLSKQGQELKDLYTALQAKDKELTTQREAIDAIMGRVKPQEKKNELADDEVITGAQAKAFIADALKQSTESLRGELRDQIQKDNLSSEQARQFQRWEERVEDTTERLVKENPILKHVPQLGLLLKREALSEKPTSEKEMVTALVNAGKRIAASLDGEIDSRIKEKAERKAAAVAKGPQAPGGTQTFDTFVKNPSKYMRGHRSVNFDEIERDATAFLEALDE